MDYETNERTVEVDSTTEALAEIEKRYSRGSGISFREIIQGLKMPVGSREYKLARIGLQRMIAIVAAVVLPVLFAIILFVVTAINAKDEEKIEINIAKVDDKVEEIQEEEPPPPPEEQPTDVDVDVVPDAGYQDAPDMNAPVNTQIVSSQPMNAPPLDAVSMVRSPVTMKSMLGGIRSGGCRRGALNKYGGNAQTEACVMRALRWLKTQQNSDGSWGPPNAKEIDGTPTGYALLAFLAHGEQPTIDAGATEFGDTVYRGIQYLMSRSDYAEDGRESDLHALCEAYGLTKNPNIREAVEAGLVAKCKKIATRNWATGTNLKHNRAGFTAMALKSARMSGFDNPEIDQATTNLVKGIMAQYNPSTGRFGGGKYGPPPADSPVKYIGHAFGYVAALQYLGEGSLPCVKKAYDTVNAVWPGPTLEPTEYACCPQRHNYFASMLYFNNQDPRWDKWNSGMKAAYVPSQIVETGKYKDHKGVEHDIGHWESGDDHVKNKPLVPTCLVALQLMVYYRYLPTSSEKAWSAVEKIDTKAVEQPAADNAVDVDI